MKSDKPIPDGVFWMVWDASGFYNVERRIFTFKRDAKEMVEVKKDQDDGGKWRITKVKVTSP